MLALKTKSSSSTSSADIAKTKSLSSSTNSFSINVKTGASLTDKTLIVTTPTTDVQVPSETVKVKLSVPLKLRVGV